MCSSDLQKQIIKLACPSRVKLSILSVDTSLRRFQENAYQDERVLVICKSIDTIKKIVDDGYLFESVNISNLTCKSSGLQVKPSLCLGDNDIENLKYIQNRGVKIYSLGTPNDENIDLESIVNSHEKS